MIGVFKRSRNYFTMIVLALFVMVSFGSGQMANAQGVPCPPDQAGCTWGAWKTGTKLISDAGCEADYEYRIRICNGQIDIQYNILALRGSCAYFEEHNLDEAQISSVKEMIEIALMLLIPHLEDPTAPIPVCPDENLYVNYYTAACGVWLKCTYDVEPQSPQCDPGFSPLPDPANTTVDLWQWFDCGDACCTRSYTVCRSSPTSSGIFFSRVGPPQQLGECSLQSQFPSKTCRTYCYIN